MGNAGVETHDYDVCLSFAGERRAYVEKVAEALLTRHIRVFYDAYEQADLWGKDLYRHLDNIYRQSAVFCVVFVSEEYATKVWTNHELKSAQARAVAENEEYILPARFDDTDLPGLRPTIGYVDLTKISPDELSALICRETAHDQRGATSRQAGPVCQPRESTGRGQAGEKNR